MQLCHDLAALTELLVHAMTRLGDGLVSANPSSAITAQVCSGKDSYAPSH